LNERVREPTDSRQRPSLVKEFNYSDGTRDPAKKLPTRSHSLHRVEAARENLLKQGESMTPEQRKARLVNLRTESIYWADRERWVQVQVEEGAYEFEWLASGGVPKYETP
jgi:hypothetical protein